MSHLDTGEARRRRLGLVFRIAGLGDVALNRIRIDRTHIAGSIDPVNPVYIYKVEQIRGR